MKKSYFLAAAVGLFALSAAPAMAFHGGGVAHCDGCHSMHNSPENPITGSANEGLMKGSDASSTCLNCHNGAGGYHINSTDGSNLNEGGDFGWLSVDYTVNVRGNIVNYGGDNTGHNVVAIDPGLTVDSTNTVAPGGTYVSEKLGCTSCHDAHGQVLDGTAGGSLAVGISGSYSKPAPAGTIKGNFRLLGDEMYEAGHNINDAFAFTNGAPVALSVNSSAGAKTYGEKTRYGSGMSQWCANCHGDYLNVSPDSASGKHPTSVLLSKDGYDTNYNSYVKTGDFTGVIGTAYDDMVPFETGTDQEALILAGVGSTVGAGTTAQVMCLSCHRAHASAHNNSGRWDFETDLLVGSAALASADIPVTSVPYYADGMAVTVATKYGVGQRSLCNKCHVQD